MFTRVFDNWRTQVKKERLQGVFLFCEKHKNYCNRGRVCLLSIVHILYMLFHEGQRTAFEFTLNDFFIPSE